MAEQRLDLLVLRLAAARDQGRVRTNVGLDIRVAAAQLAELALDGSLIDYEGRPAVVWSGGPDPLAPLLARLQELAGWRWEQLLWRQGIDAPAGLRRAAAELVTSGTWIRAGRPLLRSDRYTDLGGAELRAHAERLDAVIAGEVEPVSRESALVALMALRFVKTGDAEWRQRAWVTDENLTELPDRQRIAIHSIIEAGQQIAAMARAGGTAIATQGGG